MPTRHAGTFAAVLIGLVSISGGSAVAATVDFQFTADLTSGPLAGTIFTGTGGYDATGSTGTGQVFATLTSLDFSLLGVSFTHADLVEGGQATLQDRVLTDFTADFEPPPPANAPVFDLAFGFGGPGVIGYNAPPNGAFGSGSYTLSTVPEPATLWPGLLGLAGALIGLRRQGVAARA